MKQSTRVLTKFGEAVEKMRRRRGMPKTVLAKRIGISAQYYDMIIHGERSENAQKENILRVLTDSAKDIA